MDKAQQSLPLKPILFRASKAQLWKRPTAGRKVVVKLHSLLPSLKIPSHIVRYLWGAISKRPPHEGATGHLLGSKHTPTHFLSIDLKECQWGICTPRTASDYSIRVYYKPRCLDISLQDMEFIQQSVACKIDSYAEFEYLEPTDLCKTVISCTVLQSKLIIRATLLYPSVTLQYQQIPSISIVSTPLALSLTQAQSQTYQTGYLTMDSKRRLLPLAISDYLAFKYPIIGVWASAVPNENKEFPFTHPLVWTACVRFIESKSLTDRVSPDPANTAFLLVYFGEKASFYEVLALDKPAWGVTTSQYDVAADESVVCKFLRAAAEKPTRSASEDKQSTRASTGRLASNLSPRAQRLMMRQTLTLKQLQRQVQELQSQLSTPRAKRVESLSQSEGVPRIVCESSWVSSEDDILKQQANQALLISSHFTTLIQTIILQTGHWSLIWIHCSMHSVWKMCPHRLIALLSSSAAINCRQIEQVSSDYRSS